MGFPVPDIYFLHAIPRNLLKDKHNQEMGQMRSAVDEMTITMDDMRGVHISDLIATKKKVDTQKATTHNEKQRRRHAEQKVIDVQKECRAQLKDIQLFLRDTLAQLKVSVPIVVYLQVAIVTHTH